VDNVKDDGPIYENPVIDTLPADEIPASKLNFEIAGMLSQLILPTSVSVLKSKEVRLGVL